MHADQHRRTGVLEWALQPDRARLWPRWLFLRGLGACFGGAFLSLQLQAPGLIGHDGIQPVARYLAQMETFLGWRRFWQVPTLLWVDSGDMALRGLCTLGLVAAAMLVINVWPRMAVAVCTVVFLSFATVLQRFSSFQMDGLLIEAGFLACFHAPSGLRPGLGERTPPARLASFALLWLLFRLYFESGLAKAMGGDSRWWSLTAMDRYYEDSPLPTVLAWYAQQWLPLWFHRASLVVMLAIELVLIWAVFLPRRLRIPLFFTTTALQLGIVATANYGPLNWLALALGLLLLDDKFLAGLRLPTPTTDVAPAWRTMRIAGALLIVQVTLTGALLLKRFLPIPSALPAVVAPLRIVNVFALFGTLGSQHVEIEFQGSRDGQEWTPYPFRYKPQDVREMPGFFAPVPARLELALSTAAADQEWKKDGWIELVERRLLAGSPDVLRLFQRDPFSGEAPRFVRAVTYRYTFASVEQHRADGAYWQRTSPEPFGPVLDHEASDVASTSAR